METETESEITTIDIQGFELEDNDTNSDFTRLVVALDGVRSIFYT